MGLQRKNTSFIVWREAQQPWRRGELLDLGRWTCQKYAAVYISAVVHLPFAVWWGTTDPATPYYRWRWGDSEDFFEFNLQKDKAGRRFVTTEDCIRSSLTSIGIKPFMLWPNPTEPWLCPVRALLKWVQISGLTEGFLFRQISANDQLTLSNRQLVRCYRRIK